MARTSLIVAPAVSAALLQGASITTITITTIINITTYYIGITTYIMGILIIVLSITTYYMIIIIMIVVRPPYFGAQVLGPCVEVEFWAIA